MLEGVRYLFTIVKAVGRIANTELQDRVGISKRTAHRDLSALARRGVLRKVGTTGKGTFYALIKGAIKGPKGPAKPKSNLQGRRKDGYKKDGEELK
jgi:predicted DNA-binding transcriptional regulator YafY